MDVAKLTALTKVYRAISGGSISPPDVAAAIQKITGVVVPAPFHPFLGEIAQKAIGKAETVDYQPVIDRLADAFVVAQATPAAELTGGHLLDFLSLVYPDMRVSKGSAETIASAVRAHAKPEQSLWDFVVSVHMLNMISGKPPIKDPIEFTAYCGHCGFPMEANQHDVGDVTRCDSCGQPFTILIGATHESHLETA